MFELCQTVLDCIEMGVIIIDGDQRIVSWNRYIERLSGLRSSAVNDRPLTEICPLFAQARYQAILTDAFEKNQCRFCSSKLHKALIYPRDDNAAPVRQNVTIMPITMSSQKYVVIQVTDITYQVNNEHKLTSLINEMKKGYLEIKESEEFNRRLAVTDPLTGLPNRFALLQYLEGVMGGAKKDENYFLMFIDLDGFKRVNDTYGHSVGDRLLVITGERMRTGVRSEDMVARLGGDEFVVIIHSAGGMEGARKVASKLLNEVARPAAAEGVIIRITCSIGVAAMAGGEDRPDDLIRLADMAMYESKKNGKNMYTIYGENNGGQ